MKQEDNPTREFLGYGVYVQMDGRKALCLTREDGSRITNTFYLEPVTYKALVNYLRRHQEKNYD